MMLYTMQWLDRGGDNKPVQVGTITRHRWVTSNMLCRHLTMRFHSQNHGGLPTRGSSSNLLHVPGLQPSYTNLHQVPKARPCCVFACAGALLRLHLSCRRSLTYLCLSNGGQ